MQKASHTASRREKLESASELHDALQKRKLDMDGVATAVLQHSGCSVEASTGAADDIDVDAVWIAFSG